MADADATAPAPANAEAIEAWNTVLFDKWVRFRRITIAGAGAHGQVALERHPPPVGGQVLDVGVGFGDSSLALGARVGPTGAVVGVDAASRFIDVARTEAAAAGAGNVHYEVADIETMNLERRFDYAFARFATMFLTFPVLGLRNIRRHLQPGAPLCMVVWRRKLDNEWLHRAERVVEEFVAPPEDSDAVTCGPGPFSQADANVVTDQLQAAGFHQVTLERHDRAYAIGRDLDDAVEVAMAIGPAGEVLRLAGADADAVRPRLAAALRDAFADLVTADGVMAPSSTWIVSARA